MFNCMPLRKSPVAAPAAHAARRGAARWRLWIAILATISLLVVLTASASHYHPDSASEDACAVCSAPLDKIVDLAPLPPAQPERHLSTYHLPPPASAGLAQLSSTLFPPACGPPRAAA
jgi:hypothetical protein